MRAKLWFGAATAALLMFGFTPASAQDGDPAGDASTQARLNGSADGEIGTAGDLDWYRLHVEHGQRYNFTLDGVPNAEGAALDPVIVLYDAQGAQLAFNDDSAESLNSMLQYAPAQSGDIFVEARGFSEEATGAYRLAVTNEAVPPDDAGNDATTRARASVGRAVTGNIEYEGDVDWYRLSARTGQTYRIALAGSGDAALGDPVLRVVGRDGTELAANDDSEGSLNSALEFTPTANGEVFIEAGAYNAGYTGTYTLNVASERAPTDGISANRNTRGHLTIGQSTTSTLDFPTDHDWYRVRLEEGQSYRFTLNSDGENPLGDPMLHIQNAAGEEIAVDDDGGEGFNSYLEFTAPSTGTYFIDAGAFGDGATGGYTLGARAGDIPADNTTDASLSADGDYREGVLAPAGDRDWYRLTLTEGQGMRIAMTGTEASDTLGDPYLVLYGPNGEELVRDDDGGDGLNAWLEFQAPTAGAYYIEARGFSDDATGRYALSLTAGEVGSSADTAEYIAPNSEGRSSLIGTDGDSDWYAFDTIEGRPYRIMLDGVEDGALADPLLTIYDEQGNEVATDDDGGAGFGSYVTLMPATGGRFYAAASSFNNTGTGRYMLRVVDTDVPGHPGTDEYLDANNDERASRIEVQGDLDNYHVELEGGVRYEISVSGAGENPLADPFLAIVDGDNNRVVTDDDSGPGLDARLRFTPEQSGTYFIQASGLGGSVGGYQVRIMRQ